MSQLMMLLIYDQMILYNSQPYIDAAGLIQKHYKTEEQNEN